MYAAKLLALNIFVDVFFLHKYVSNYVSYVSVTSPDFYIINYDTFELNKTPSADGKICWSDGKLFGL